MSVCFFLWGHTKVKSNFTERADIFFPRVHLFHLWTQPTWLTNCAWLMLETLTYVQLLFPTSHPPPSPTLFCCLSLTAALRSSWSRAELPASISVIGARHTHHSFWCVVVTERGEQWGGKGWGQMWAGTVVQLKLHTSQAVRQAGHHTDLILFFRSAQFPHTPFFSVLCVCVREHILVKGTRWG